MSQPNGPHANAPDRPSSQPRQGLLSRLLRRRGDGQLWRERLFHLFCAAVAWSGLVILVVLLFHVTRVGWPVLSWKFLTSPPSRFPHRAGIYPALMGTLWLIGLTTLFTVPVGVGAAIYLEEFAAPSRWNRFIELNIANLAGVPSIIYGVLGLGVFVRWMHLGRSVLAGALTMSLLILPVVIIAAREAIRAVPDSIRQGAFALGATRWQAVRDHVLPSALPGILTGIILSIARAIGETAPLITIGALTYVVFVPESPLDRFTVLPIQIYNWASDSRRPFHDLAGAAIVVLLAVLLTVNAVAVWIRHRFEKYRMR